MRLYHFSIHWKRLWCWEGLGAGGEGDNRGWDGWMASPTRWTWVWMNSGTWWWTGRPGVLHAVHGVAKSRTRLSNWTELNWTDTILDIGFSFLFFPISKWRHMGVKTNKQNNLHKEDTPGLPWWSSGPDSTLPMQGARVWSLISELKGASLGLSRKESACQCRRCGFDPWVRQIPWRRER